MSIPQSIADRSTEPETTIPEPLMKPLISDLIGPKKPTFSFEFFPPKSDEGADKLFDHITKLEDLAPSFVSVTYGAGGSTRQLTKDLVLRTDRETGLTVMPHLTCVKHTRADIDEILEGYAQGGIRNILALRGDPPNNEPYDWNTSEYRYASDLIHHIKSWGDRNKVNFAIGVAGFPEGHPSTPNRLEEMDHLKAKVECGADFIITQMFFENRDYYDFRDRCNLAGIRIPIIAGIMPVQSIKGMRRMAQLALGMRFPASMLRAIRRTDGSDESIRRVGVHWATEQSRDLLDHDVGGLHFYTLNKSGATLEIYKTLGVQNSNQLTDDPTLQI